MKAHIFGVGVSLLIASNVYAGDAAPERGSTVQDLYNACKSNLEVANVICEQYIAGVMDVMSLVGAADDRKVGPAFGMCVGDGYVSYQAARQVFINWAEKHPKLWDKGRDFGVMIAMRQAWPCPPLK
jgi:hypothetical protein